MSSNALNAYEFISQTEISYTPRILSGLTIAVSLITLAILASASPGASIAFQMNCLNVAFYTGILGGAFLGVSLIRDVAQSVLMGIEYGPKRGFSDFVANAGQSMIAPLIGGGIALFIIIWP